MGDYIKPQTTRVFMERQNDGVRNDLAGLHDCRLVTTSEIGKHGVLDAPMIKEFTGGDLSAGGRRHLRVGSNRLCLFEQRNSRVSQARITVCVLFAMLQSLYGSTRDL